jgi:hypothetical protein
MTVSHITTKIGPVIPEIQRMVARFGGAGRSRRPADAGDPSATRRGSRSAPGNAVVLLRRRNYV